MVRTSTSSGAATNHTATTRNQITDRSAFDRAFRDVRVPSFARHTRASANAANATKTTLRGTAPNAIKTANTANGANDMTHSHPPARSALSSLDTNIRMLRSHKSPRPSVAQSLNKSVPSRVKAEVAGTRTRANRDLQSLPVEIFDQIMTLLLESVGPVRVLHLRVVSKTFNVFILRTICDSYLNDRQGSFHNWLSKLIKNLTTIAPPLMGRLIFSQMNAQPSNSLFDPIRDAVRYLDEHSPVAEAQSQDRALKVCEGAADYFYWEEDHTLKVAWSRDDLPQSQPSKQHIFSAAIITGNTSVVRNLLSSQHAKCVDVNCQNPHFGTPLNQAARWGHIDIVRLLLDHDADTGAVEQSERFHFGGYWGTHGPGRTRKSYYNKDGSALRVACSAGHLNIVRVLMRPKHRKTISYHEFRCCIYAAARVHRAGIAEFLMGNGGELLKGFVDIGACVLPGKDFMMIYYQLANVGHNVEYYLVPL